MSSDNFYYVVYRPEDPMDECYDVYMGFESSYADVEKEVRDMWMYQMLNAFRDRIDKEIGERYHASYSGVVQSSHASKEEARKWANEEYSEYGIRDMGLDH